MRPLELRLKGFRSYRGEVTFDLRGRRLVGVVGPIGSGKSSILDAVAFALYGKTPTIEGNTKSLIHQLSDECHVELRFEVDGQVWRAVRALRRRGASGHQLWRLAADDPEASILEEITGEKPVRERVEQLLGMEFDAFCRSVLLAQNRFADFLRATPKARNEVLKGVFGYERFDAAHDAARGRVVVATASLEALASEGGRLAEARARLADAEARLAEATTRAEQLERGRGSVDAAMGARREAAERATSAGSAIGAITTAGEQLGSIAAEERLEAAERASDDVERATQAVTVAGAIRKDAEAACAAVAERVGDQGAFAALVQEHDHRAEAAREAADRLGAATEAAAAGRETVREAADAASEANRAVTAATDALALTEAELVEAEAARHGAHQADAARSLRAELVAGEPCPVCAQPVTTVPKVGRAPAVAAAEKAEKAARNRVADARAVSQAAAGAVATAEARHAAAATRSAELDVDATAEAERRRTADAALAAVASELVDRLGEGDPRALIEERQAELRAAQTARDEAIAAESEAREALDAARLGGDEAASVLADLAARLASAWGMLGERHGGDASPASLRRSFIDLGEALVGRLAEAQAAREAALAAVAEADATLAELLGELGLGADDDVTLALAEAAAARGAAEQEVAQLAATIQAGADLDARLAAAERARDLATRLAADLQPSRFLAFLLEEERAALANLGSTHFEELSGGGYRFTDDDRFDVLDLNAAATERRADSLSGGETFLASLALALALAEMVARGGGRLDAFFLDEGFGSLDPEHLDRAMAGIEHLVAEDGQRLVVLVSHVAEMRQAIEDLVVLDKDPRTGDTVVVSGASPSA
ncbi:MAG: AAA family ATPase [Actinomycetota bacterium]